MSNDSFYYQTEENIGPREGSKKNPSTQHGFRVKYPINCLSERATQGLHDKKKKDSATKKEEQVTRETCCYQMD